MVGQVGGAMRGAVLASRPRRFLSTNKQGEGAVALPDPLEVVKTQAFFFVFGLAFHAVLVTVAIPHWLCGRR